MSSNTFNFHDVTFGNIIEASSNQFYFGGTTNGPSNVYPTTMNNSTDGSGNTSMILANI